MFSRIAERYDLANDLLSFGTHRAWRRTAVRMLAPQNGERILDLCTGTGDQTFAIHRANRSTSVVGLDFVWNMLAEAERKRSSSGTARNENAKISFLRGDACRLPFSDASFDAAAISFGIRNVDDPLVCLRDIRRVLRNSGRLMVLEFGRPRAPMFSFVYDQIYTRWVMPTLGGVVTGDRGAYEYLPRTAKNFPDGQNFLELMRQAQFTDLTLKPLFSGLAYIYLGRAKPCS